MATEKKPPITCHVLDTTIGKPASNIPVELTIISYYTITSTSASTSTSTSNINITPAGTKFKAVTNADGRVTAWTPAGPFNSATIEEVYNLEGDLQCSLSFDTEEYFGERVKTFFPVVEVRFRIRQEAKEEHYHVPVLLGPFGYTTYRGS